MSDDGLTLTPEEIAELEAQLAESADPATWKRWARQAAQQAVAERIAWNLGRELPDWDDDP